MKIESLTTEQQASIAAHRQHYFKMATSTEPADRPRAEAAARRLAEIAGVEIGECVWVLSPSDGAAQYAAKLASLRDSLWDSPWASLRAWMGDSLWASLRASMENPLRNSLENSLWASLQDSLEDPLRNSLEDSLWDSLWDSLRDTGWMAFFDYPRQLGVQYDPAQAEKLDLWIQTLQSCFAVWLVPGTAILCERPDAVDIDSAGRLVGITWRKE